MFYCLEGLRLFFVGVQNTPGFFDELIADIFPFWTNLIEKKCNRAKKLRKKCAKIVIHTREENRLKDILEKCGEFYQPLNFPSHPSLPIFAL